MQYHYTTTSWETIYFMSYLMIVPLHILYNTCIWCMQGQAVKCNAKIAVMIIMVVVTCNAMTSYISCSIHSDVITGECTQVITFQRITARAHAKLCNGRREIHWKCSIYHSSLQLTCWRVGFGHVWLSTTLKIGFPIEQEITLQLFDEQYTSL